MHAHEMQLQHPGVHYVHYVCISMCTVCTVYALLMHISNYFSREEDMDDMDGLGPCMHKPVDVYCLATKPVPQDCFPSPLGGADIRQSGISVPVQVCGVEETAACMRGRV